jgi:DHA3 family macrolide efflux protein-like MFS transporter
MFFASFMNPIASGALLSILQVIVPADMQGRVFTLLQSAVGVMVPLGLIIAGPLANVLGCQIWYLAGGVAMAVMGIGALFVPAITRLDETATGSSREAIKLDDPAAVPATAR